MALFFDANTELVDYGNDASLNALAELTMMGVVRLTEIDGSIHTALTKGSEHYIREQNTANWSTQRDYTTTDCAIVTDDTPITVNVWHIVFFADGGAGVAPHLYSADLGSDLVESSYSVQLTPAGSLVSDASDNLEIGHGTDATRSWVGDIHAAGWIASALSLGQCKSVYYRLMNANAHSAKMLSILGWNGTGTQPDLSGNGNNGTVTGATVSDSAPLGPPFGFDIGLSTIVGVGGRIMSSLAAHGGLAAEGGIAGIGGGLAAASKHEDWVSSLHV